MITAIQELADLLSNDPVTVDEVVEHLGIPTEQFSGNVLVNPDNAAFDSANIVHHVSDIAPAHVTLDLTEPLPLATLAATFGTYKIMVEDEGIPPKALFSLDMTGKPYRVKLIANLTANKDDSDVTAVTLRRDIRL